MDSSKEQITKKINEREGLLNKGQLSSGSSLDVIFTIDTTGSMDPFINEVQDNILKVIETVLEYSPRVRMGFISYKDHGDEGEDEFYLTKILPLSFDRKEIVNFVRSPDLHIGEGGDGPEAVECALHEAVNFNWSPTAPKAVVLIGDKPPHGVIDSFRSCPRMKDYRQEVAALKRKGTKIYPILCNNISETESSFRWMAQETGGKFFYLKELSDLSDLLIGICLKETGKLPYFTKKLLEYGGMSQSKKVLLLELSK